MDDEVNPGIWVIFCPRYVPVRSCYYRFNLSTMHISFSVCLSLLINPSQGDRVPLYILRQIISVFRYEQTRPAP